MSVCFYYVYLGEHESGWVYFLPLHSAKHQIIVGNFSGSTKSTLQAIALQEQGIINFMYSYFKYISTSRISYIFS